MEARWCSTRSASWSASVQAKLLRAVQEGEVQQLGSSAIRNVDVRIVACTNRDLEADAKSGRFREDLYYRLAVVEFVIPPLRERPEDIAPLAQEFARRYAERFGLESDELPSSLITRLKEMSWPGNVRQLDNTIARLAALSRNRFDDADLGLVAPSSRVLPAGVRCRRTDVRLTQRGGRGIRAAALGSRAVCRRWQHE